ncbi:ATP-dependent Clp protease adaptor ClpS [Haloechinothrix halophila]|uniref:ATP-dependent Clp protease adaptor ClpS n=1 Tax=Haloechinothrix halophila TaxID=1069073 RepID=UPI00042774E6|nr:ATP-dependent Clp protease adaptor ClpS [Haloechinothrix halophila]
MRRRDSGVTRAWAVLLHDDDINTVEGVCYVLYEVFGIPVENGAHAAAEVSSTGSAVLGQYESQEQAESFVAQLQLYGLCATMKWV